jgi:hypothetical protein
MWNTQAIDSGRSDLMRLVVRRGSEPMSCSDVVEAWRANSGFRKWFNGRLAGSTFEAFRWETPPVTVATTGQPFEFVLLDSPGLLRDPDPRAFGEHFDRRPGSDVLTFPNLGGDAVMVVPCPADSPAGYAHLAAFVRDAPQRQQDALWRSVGEAMAGRMGVETVWLSTAGGGVAWLHVRLDDRPKYYGFEPYRRHRRPEVNMDRIVITRHRSQYPDPIRFEKGDALTLGRRDDEYPGWIRVVIPSGNEGWAPESYIRIEAPTSGVATRAYTARELNTEVGERLSYKSELNGWLWVENTKGESGWVPKETVRLA